MERNQLSSRRIITMIIFTVLLIWSVFNFERVGGLLNGARVLIGPFITGMVIAFVLNLPMRFIEGHIFKKAWSKGEKFRGAIRRGVSIFGSILFIVAIIAALGFVVIPEIVQVFVTLGEQLPDYLTDVEDWVAINSGREDVFGQLFEIANNSMADLADRFLSWLRDSVTQIASSALSAVTSFASAVINFVLALIFAIYCLAKKETLGRQVKQIIYSVLPERWADSIVSVGSLSISVFSRFVSGQTLEALILGFMFFLGMTILRLPYAVMIGALTTVTALIPIFGAIFSAVIGGALILIQDPFQALVFLIMAVVIQQIEGDVVYPHVVGSAVGLPSIWTFVAVTLGGTIAGVLGMIIAVPLASILYTLVTAGVNKRLNNKEINPLKLSFSLLDPRPGEGEDEPGRRRRLARIAVGAESHEERIAREQAGEREHAEELAAEWENDLIDRYHRYEEALTRRDPNQTDTKKRLGRGRWFDRR